METNNKGQIVLATDILNTDKPLVFGIINTANYDVMGYMFVAGDTPDCLMEVGCWDEDVEKADRLKVGETISAFWLEDNAVIIIKLKDSRE